MDHRQRILAAVIITIIISFSVGFVSEYIRESMVFSWAIEEGDEFDFDVTVKGNMTAGLTVIPPPYASMNNTRISVQIVSLPNVSIIFYASSFIENVVQYSKTSTSFVNGTSIPISNYAEINTLMSRCILPIGGWGHLDLLFPNQFDRPIMNQESYISTHLRTSILFGYKSNTSSYEFEWQGIIDLDRGVPLTAFFRIHQVGQPWIHSYTVEMTLVD
jgi:hypothetical protein